MSFPRGRARSPFRSGLIALLLAAGVIGVSCSSSTEPSAEQSDGLATGGAALGVAAFVDAQALPPDTGSVDLATCPAPAIESMLTSLAAAEHNWSVATAFAVPGTPGRDVNCTVGIDPALGLGTGQTGIESWVAGVSTGLGDLETYLTTIYADFTPSPEIQLDVRPAEDFEGGQFRFVCLIDAEAAGYNSCEVDWVGDGLIVYLLAAGEQATGVDLDAMRSTLAAALPDILGSVAELGQP